MFCSLCGNAVEGNARFCSQCGTVIPASNAAAAQVVPEPQAAEFESSQPNVSSTVYRKPEPIDRARVLLLLLKLAGLTALLLVLVMAAGFGPAPTIITIIAVATIAFAGRHLKRLLKTWRAMALTAAIVLGVVIILQSFYLHNEHLRAAAEAKAKAEIARRAKEAAEREQARFNALSPAEHLNVARGLLNGVETPQSSVNEAFRHLGAIPNSSPLSNTGKELRAGYLKKRQEAQAAAAKTRAAVEAATKRVIRDAMAKTIENGLLDKGYNVDVIATGADHTVLQIKWILVSKALAHQFSHEGDFFENARKIGFKRVEITDGYDETWYWRLN